MFGLCKFINTNFSLAISMSSIRNLPSVSLIFFLIVMSFVPRKVIATPHEFEVLCEKNSALNSSLHRTSSFNVEYVSCKNSTPFGNNFGCFFCFVLFYFFVFCFGLKAFYVIRNYTEIIEQLFIKKINLLIFKIRLG